MKENREYRYIPFTTRQTEDGLTVVEGTVIRYGDSGGHRRMVPNRGIQGRMGDKLV